MVVAGATITGSGVSAEDGALDLSGTVNESGRVAAGVTGTGATWEGQFCETNVAGERESRDLGDEGEFRGVNY